MKKTASFSGKSLALFTALLILSACGKSMHLTENEPAKALTVANNKLMGALGSVTGPALDGALTPLSEFDQKEVAGKLPYLNTESEEGESRNIGDPSYELEENVVLDKDGKEKKDILGYVKQTNLTFRAIKQVAPAELVDKVDAFELHLKGVRVLSDQAQDSIDFGKQLLCVIETAHCAGELPDQKSEAGKNLNSNLNLEIFNDVIASNAKLVAHQSFKSGLSLYQASDEIVIDLKEAFGLKSLSTEEMMKWIADNSTEFASPGYRKFRFVMANNTYVDSGNLVLTVSLKKGKQLPADFAQMPTKPTHEQDDVISAKANVVKPLTAPAALNLPSAPKVDSKAVAQLETIPSNSGVTTVTPPVDKVITGHPIDFKSIEAKSEVVPNQLIVIQISNDSLKFEGGTAKLTKKDAAKISKLGSLLKEKMALIRSIMVSAQTDKAGSDAENGELSEKRAGVIASLLSKAGVDKSILSKNALGEVAQSSCGAVEKCEKDRWVSLTLQLNPSVTEAERQELANIWK